MIINYTTRLYRMLRNQKRRVCDKIKYQLQRSLQEFKGGNALTEFDAGMYEVALVICFPVDIQTPRVHMNNFAPVKIRILIK